MKTAQRAAALMFIFSKNQEFSHGNAAWSPSPDIKMDENGEIREIKRPIFLWIYEEIRRELTAGEWYVNLWLEQKRMSLHRALRAMFPPTNTRDTFDWTAKPNNDQSNVHFLNKPAINASKFGTFDFCFSSLDSWKFSLIQLVGVRLVLPQKPIR